jgi:hypothetical protein
LNRSLAIGLCVVAGVATVTILLCLFLPPQPGRAGDLETSPASRGSDAIARLSPALAACARARGSRDALLSIGTIQIRGTIMLSGGESNDTTIYCDEFEGQPRIYFYRETPDRHSALSLVSGRGLDIRRPGPQPEIEPLDAQTTLNLATLARGILCAASFPLDDDYSETAPHTFSGKKHGIEITVNSQYLATALAIPRGPDRESWRFEGTSMSGELQFPRAIECLSSSTAAGWKMTVQQWGIHAHVTDGFFEGRTAGSGIKHTDGKVTPGTAPGPGRK